MLRIICSAATDEEREKRLGIIVGEVFKKQMEWLSPQDKYIQIDFRCWDDKGQCGWAEVRARRTRHNSFESFLLNLSKWQVLRENEPSLLVVGFFDGVFAMKLSEIPFEECTTSRIIENGRGRDVIYIPTRYFRRISDENVWLCSDVSFESTSFA